MLALSQDTRLQRYGDGHFYYLGGQCNNGDVTAPAVRKTICHHRYLHQNSNGHSFIAKQPFSHWSNLLINAQIITILYKGPFRRLLQLINNSSLLVLLTVISTLILEFVPKLVFQMASIIISFYCKNFHCTYHYQIPIFVKFQSFCFHKQIHRETENDRFERYF